MHEIRSKRHEDSWLDTDRNSGKKRNHPWAEDRFDKEWALYALLSVPELEKENWGGKKSFAKGQLSLYRQPRKNLIVKSQPDILRPLCRTFGRRTFGRHTFGCARLCLRL